MKPLSFTTACLLALLVLAGCASTTVTARQQYHGAKIARPDRIIIHDFAATPADIPAGSAMASRYSAQSPTLQSAQEVAVGRQLGTEVAKDLVAKIRSMGLPAVRAVGEPAPRVGDIVIMGYFESVDTGSAVKRVALGFGSGAAELTTTVEGYLMTRQGLRRLGYGTVESGGGKAPGAAVPLAVTIASGNPIGLIVGGALKVGGEVTGSSTIEGSAQRTAEEIAKQLQTKFQELGWI